MDFNGANGITMSGSGGEINCRWDINRSDSHTMTNNDNNPDPLTYFQNWGTFFTAPYAGSYVWIRRSGWSASVSGGVKNAGIRVIKNNNKSTSYSIFFQNESGTCAASGAIEPAGWEDYTAFAMNPGDTFQYGSSTRFSTGSSCSPTTLNATVGNAVLLYDN
ncbi:hypothetical protein LUD75_10590 [Epilithonimonas sp. JDS]|uniref:hypothetical protein n=1 Tax=Epilithonimonas sp. JDS TaxID=2902797 RepID=UPI001E2E1642|nr:hypothetical protein [Epilithonimonas sp. JDS]MCD9855158.1 hypothetical protein [Epilithonimonas sp. JDS]